MSSSKTAKVHRVNLSNVIVELVRGERDIDPGMIEAHSVKMRAVPEASDDAIAVQERTPEMAEWVRASAEAPPLTAEDTVRLAERSLRWRPAAMQSGH